jgi:hypothetical protein
MFPVFLRLFVISSKSISNIHQEFLLIDVELSCDKQTSKRGADVYFLPTSTVSNLKPQTQTSDPRPQTTDPPDPRLRTQPQLEPLISHFGSHSFARD